MEADIPWLVVPTYNEAENLESLVQAATKAMRKASPEGFVMLVVDDNSPDGTGELADRLAAEREELRVLHRPAKGGLGPAYLAGFGQALAGGAGYVLEMDADFSHDPEDLGRLLAAARDGADLVLGSRYVPGGGVRDWGPLRRLISRGGSVYARAILGVGQHDLTGGFKCFRRATLEAIDLATVTSKGYAFQIELTYRAARRGLRIVEVPIVFRERRVGQSKMSARIAFEAFWRVPQIRGWRP
ncbi:MAG: polyprenol monophosphomannose synthase [Thermoleophilaceae bacterium]